MPNTDQAQADPTDDQTVSDPLDVENTHDDGTSELSSYADEIAALNLDEIPGDEPEEETAEEDEIPEESKGMDLCLVNCNGYGTHEQPCRVSVCKTFRWNIF